MSFPSRTRFFVSGSSAGRGGRIGDLLHTDSDVHGRALLLKSEPSTNRARESWSAWPVRPRPSPLALQLRPGGRPSTVRARATSSVITVSTPAERRGQGVRLGPRPSRWRPSARPRGPRPPGAAFTMARLGWRARHPKPAAAATLADGSGQPVTRNPVDSSGCRWRSASRVPGQKDETTTDAPAPASPTSSATGPPGAPRGRRTARPAGS